MGEPLAIIGGVKEGEIVAKGKVWVAVRNLAGLDPAEQPASIIVRITNAFIDFHIRWTMSYISFQVSSSSKRPALLRLIHAYPGVQVVIEDDILFSISDVDLPNGENGPPIKLAFPILSNSAFNLDAS
jgi:hypothetical protein